MIELNVVNVSFVLTYQKISRSENMLEPPILTQFRPFSGRYYSSTSSLYKLAVNLNHFITNPNFNFLSNDHTIFRYLNFTYRSHSFFLL